MPQISINWLAISPEIIITSVAFIVLLADLFVSEKRRFCLGGLGLVGLAATIIPVLALYREPQRLLTFSGMFTSDSFAQFFKLIFIASAAFVILISFKYNALREIRFGEYYELILFSTLGMMIMASGNDLLIIYLGLELMAISIYILAGLMRNDIKSNEASIKYFLLGAFASAMLLYGISLIYGITGSTNLDSVRAFIATSGGQPGRELMALAIILLTVGFGFKIAAVPFHMWTPDVYEGAPTPITAFMSVGPKAAAFAVIIRVYVTALAHFRADWMMLFWVLAVLSMTVGNIIAVAQRNIKRMLAYSSIAHAGYILIGVTAYANSANGTAAREALAAILIYLFAYMLMNIGAFAVLIYMASKQSPNEMLDDFAGLATRRPLPTALMAILLLSLTGIPPTFGFYGKFYIFTAALRSGLVWLAVIGVLNSVVAAFYYFRIMVYMFMREPTRELEIARAGHILVATLIILVAGTLVLGFVPHWVIAAAAKAIPAVLG